MYNYPLIGIGSDNFESFMKNDLEKEGIAISLENLRTFPFVAQAMKNGNLSIHGLWHDIANGVLFALEGGSFKPVVIE